MPSLEQNWRERYPEEELKGDPVITDDRPGEKISRALTEIQQLAITQATAEDGMLEAEVAGNTLLLRVRIDEIREQIEQSNNLPVLTGAQQYMVVQVQGGIYVVDWPRFHA